MLELCRRRVLGGSGDGVLDLRCGHLLRDRRNDLLQLQSGHICIVVCLISLHNLCFGDLCANDRLDGLHGLCRGDLCERGGTDELHRLRSGHLLHRRLGFRL